MKTKIKRAKKIYKLLGLMKKGVVNSNTFMSINRKVVKGVYDRQSEERGFNKSDPIKHPNGRQRPIIVAFSPNPPFMK